MEWKILPILWLSLKRAAMALGFLLIINIVMVLIIVGSVENKAVAPSLPNEMVLFLELEDGLNELPAQASFSDPYYGKALTIRQMVETLDRASTDPRVQGILARMRSGSFSIAHVGELRAALKRFRDTGKFAHIYSSSFGEGGGGLGRYYLASAFDQIWMQPLGIVSIPGINAEMPFLRGTLDKLGVNPQFFQRKEYKTAYESLTNSRISPENKEMMQRLVNDLRAELVTAISSDRNMDAKSFERLVDQGLFTAQEAEKVGLITRADYGDVLLDDVAEQLTGERDYEQLDIVDIKDYEKQTRGGIGHGFMKSGKSKVALVYAVGAIMPTSGSQSPGLTDDGIAAADEIAPAILDAAKDDSIEAIVMRVDSPGGSPTASESILRSIEIAKENGKPIIVSMGPTAASGGYWVAAYGDKIFAMPSTITGSIGVVGGKFSLGDMFDKVGVNFDGVRWGRNAGLWAPDTPFSASEAKQINAMLDNVYEQFIERVAKGRGMDVAAVDKVAGGRVWTGTRAKEVGLVDELGGLDAALDHTAKLIGEKNRQDLELVLLPKPKTALEVLTELLEGQARMGQAIRWQEQLRDVMAPALEVLQVQQRPQDYMTYESLRLQ